MTWGLYVVAGFGTLALFVAIQFMAAIAESVGQSEDAKTDKSFKKFNDIFYYIFSVGSWLFLIGMVIWLILMATGVVST